MKFYGGGLCKCVQILVDIKERSYNPLGTGSKTINTCSVSTTGSDFQKANLIMPPSCWVRTRIFILANVSVYLPSFFLSRALPCSLVPDKPFPFPHFLGASPYPVPLWAPLHFFIPSHCVLVNSYLFIFWTSALSHFFKEAFLYLWDWVGVCYYRMLIHSCWQLHICVIID